MRQNQKKIDIVISVIGAILLWIYVINIVNPTVTTVVRDVPINIGGAATLVERGRALAGNETYSTDVTISGPRNEVNKVTAEDISLVADVSYLSTGRQAVEVRADLPSHISLESLAESTIEVLIEEYVTAPKPVDIILSGAESGEEIRIENISLSQVDVSGAASAVAKVAALRANGDVSDAGLDTPKVLTLAITPVDDSGKAMDSVRIAQDTVGITAIVYQTKDVPLKVTFTGDAWTGAIVSETQVPSSVTIKGPATVLSQISEIESAPIDMEGIYETTTYDVEPVIPSGAYLSDTVKTLRATVKIEDEGELAFKYTVADIIIKNLDKDLKAEVSLVDAKQIDLTVRGPISTLRTLAAGDVAPSVNAANRKSGEYERVVLQPNQNIDGLTVTFSPNTVTLNISK